MKWYQNRFSISPKPRGCHIITRDVCQAIPEIREITKGLCHLFIQHTSASLTINENADPAVLRDMEMAASEIAPETLPYIHIEEGKDDMPAHVKSSMFGCDITIPIQDGKLGLGTWQGIYIMEHRDHGGRRNIIGTVYGI